MNKPQSTECKCDCHKVIDADRFGGTHSCCEPVSQLGDLRTKLKEIDGSVSSKTIDKYISLFQAQRQEIEAETRKQVAEEIDKWIKELLFKIDTSDNEYKIALKEWNKFKSKYGIQETEKPLTQKSGNRTYEQTLKTVTKIEKLQETEK